MRALKIVGLIVLVLWMAWVSLTLIQTKPIAIEACGLAAMQSEDKNGIHLPVVIYLALNSGRTAAAWSVPTATDIAFALGILALFGSRIPTTLRIFVAAFAVADDIISVLVLAAFYHRGFHPGWIAVGLVAIAGLYVLNRSRVYAAWPYVAATVPLRLSGRAGAGLRPCAQMRRRLSGPIVGPTARPHRYPRRSRRRQRRRSGIAPPAENSAVVAARVAKARERQQRRYADCGIRTNAEAEGELLDTVAAPEPAGAKLLAEAAAAMRPTARGYHRVLKVARTIADLAARESVARVHIAEALSYRRLVHMR